MKRATLFGLTLLTLAFSWSTAAVAQEGQEQQAKAKDDLPAFEEIKGVAERAFQAVPEFQPGHIVTKSQVQTVCDDIRRFGWKNFSTSKVLKDVLADDAFLARELRTKKGQEFMRKIAVLPNAYDKLDHLSRLRHGRKTVHDLINGVGGDEFIVYLTTASGGQELGKLLQNAPSGTDFNKPTGLIYTAESFLLRLKAEYDKEVAKRNKQ